MEDITLAFILPRLVFVGSLILVAQDKFDRATFFAASATFFEVIR